MFTLTSLLYKVPSSLDPILEPECSEPVETVTCPKCYEECAIDSHFKIDCISCDERFDMPEPDFDYYDLEESYVY